MKTHLIMIVVMLSSFALVSCEDTLPPKGDARMQQEVERRIEILRGELKVEETRWRTLRISCFCLLAGGSLVLLFSGMGESPSRESHPRLSGHPPYDHSQRRRMIDRHPDDDDEEGNPYWR